MVSFTAAAHLIFTGTTLKSLDRDLNLFLCVRKQDCCCLIKTTAQVTGSNGQIESEIWGRLSREMSNVWCKQPQFECFQLAMDRGCRHVWKTNNTTIYILKKKCLHLDSITLIWPQLNKKYRVSHFEISMLQYLLIINTGDEQASKFNIIIERIFKVTLSNFTQFIRSLPDLMNKRGTSPAGESRFLWTEPAINITESSIRKTISFTRSSSPRMITSSQPHPPGVWPCRYLPKISRASRCWFPL